MNCASCSRSNRAGARFCGGCGKSLAPRCAACGHELEPDARFCDSCGAASTAPPAAADAGTRKVVTIVFADLVGSTALHERVDPETARRFMDRYYAAMRAAVEAHRGVVTQFLGDGCKAVFGAPRVAEDDAIRAVRAAVEMQRLFRELAEREAGAIGKTGLRVAVNTGEVVASDATEIIGDPVNVAARLQEEARDGGVVIGEATRRLVSELVTLAPLGSFKVKGRAEAVSAYRVVSLERPAGAAATPFVGRDAELRRLEAAFDAAVTARAGRLVVILGSPGLGKSRLVAELARRVDEEATVLSARCGATGGTTFAPLAEALRLHLGLEDGASHDALRAAIESALPAGGAERARITAGVASLLAGAPAPPEETFFVVRRFLAGLAATKPVVLAIDDLQWAEPLLLDLTEHLVQWTTDAPLLVVAAARPELRDARSALATTGGLVSDVISLAGLDAGAAARVAANAIGADDLPVAVAGRVLAASEGNPLFVGELVRMLVQDGALERVGDRWTVTVQLADLEMPPTIQALLAARIERLRPEERAVLERAAIVGRQFSRSAIAELLSHDGTDLDARLESLRRSELIEPDTGWFLGEPALRFHHVLVRDAAYRRLLKGTRAELHARLADWIEGRVGEAVEHGETIGWHLEQAHEHLGELGPIDERGRAIGERAARHLAAAGRRALARDDVPPAASLLGRAIARLDPTDPARADLALDWCEALLSAGEVGPAAQAIEELGRFVEGSDRLRAWHACFAGQLAALTDPQTARGTSDAVAAAADTLARAGDVAGEAKAHSVQAIAYARLGKIGACEAALDKALAAARRANDRRRANAVLAGAPPAALWGPSPVNRASGRCLDVVRVLRITQGAPAVEAVALRCQAVLEALRGRGDAARRMIASSRKLVEELGIMQRLLEADVFAGLIELLEGQNAEAERLLRPAYDGLREHGLAIAAAQAAAFLGRALLEQGRAAEAETLSYESESLAGDDLQAAIAWRGVRAEALAKRGDHAAAIELARAAVDLAAATDALLIHADARLSLGTALRAAARHQEADPERARAIELWDAKGATILADRARRSVARAAEIARPTEDRNPTPPAALRRVLPNAATAYSEHFEAAIARRDVDTLPVLFADPVEFIDHTTGATFDGPAAIIAFRSLLHAENPNYRQEALATLGDSLGLHRVSMSASRLAGRGLDIGAYETERFMLIEVDPEGRRRRFEEFASNHLGDALGRLYSRYAELCREGPERDRAAATARSATALLGGYSPARYATAFAPDVEAVDHRTLGTWSSRGAEALNANLASWLDVATDVTIREDEVLALRPDAVLVRRTFSGKNQDGGAFERPLINLLIFGTDGLVIRGEWFDADHGAAALARFDELTREATAPPTVKRRVHPNAATTMAAATDAAVARKDADALADLNVDLVEVVDHTTGVTYDREGILASWQITLRAKEPRYHHEPLATLGDSLGIFRVTMSASEFTGRKFDVGAYERQDVHLLEMNAHGRYRHLEHFASDRLGDAIVRLYQRYAELLPDGPERDRATATARSVATLLGGYSPARFAAAWSPNVEAVDHRTLGTHTSRGAAALTATLASWLDVASDVATREDEVLALRPDAVLLHRTVSGKNHDGGAFERPLIALLIFGTDGLVIRVEWFDTDRDAEALARFDELMASAAPRLVDRRVRDNAAVRVVARLSAAVAARDADAIADVFAEGSTMLRNTTRSTFDRGALLGLWQALIRARDAKLDFVPLASLGDSLALTRFMPSASGLVRGGFDVGPYDMEEFTVGEVDATERLIWGESFAADRLGDAIVRLYERYAEQMPAGTGRERAEATARSVATSLGPFDLARYAEVLAQDVPEDIAFVDHRRIGLGPVRGAAATLDWIRSLGEIGTDITFRVEDILRLRADALLVARTTTGIDRSGGGAFENQFFFLLRFGADGRIARMEWFDMDREADALARFDELTAEPVAPPAKRRVRPNAVTAMAAGLDAAIARKRYDEIVEWNTELEEIVDHTTGLTYDREGLLASMRFMLRAKEPCYRQEPLATLGDSLGLFRVTRGASEFSGRNFDVASYERQDVDLLEVNAEGKYRRGQQFAPERLGEAVTKLYARYAELLPEGPERTRAAARARSVAVAMGPFDPDLFAPVESPSIVAIDHRAAIGWGTIRGVESFTKAMGTLLEVATDITHRIQDVVAIEPEGFLVEYTHYGTERIGGGPFERHFLVTWIFGADGLTTNLELFDVDRREEALARFDELTRHPPPSRRVRPNAATVNMMRTEAAFAARDPDAFPPLLAEELVVVDHINGTTWEREGELATYQSILKARDLRCTVEPLASLGESLTLCRWSMSASGFAGRSFDVGPYLSEYLLLNEVDEHGRRTRFEHHAPDRLGDAIIRLYERYAERLPAGPGRICAEEMARSIAGWTNAFDLEFAAKRVAPDVEAIDHRILGTWSAKGAEALLDHLRSFLALADAQMREDEILGLLPRALLIRRTNFGTDRTGGGTYERQFLALSVFDEEARLTRFEMFDTDREADALARFDEVAAAPFRRRRVRANAAAAYGSAIDAAIATRDTDAIARVFGNPLTVIDHDTAVTYDHAGGIASIRAMLRASDPALRTESIATLGDSLALFHQTVRAAGYSGQSFDVGPYLTEKIHLVTTGPDGRVGQIDIFGADRLGVAIVRLFERYAEILPAGPAGDRAAATARSIAAWARPFDLDAFAKAIAPEIAAVDHRVLGTWSASGDAAFLEHFRSILALVENARMREDDILGLRPDSLLVRRTHLGTDRTSDGSYERPFIGLSVFDSQGLITHFEWFDVDREEEALARFDELASTS